MKKLIYFFPGLCLALLAIWSPAAHATSLGTISMTVEPYASGENNGSYYVGLTDVNLKFGSTEIGTFNAFCDDFGHSISVPDTYNVVVQTVAGNSQLEQEAYLGTLFGSTPSGNSTMDSDIQELIWDLGDSATPYKFNSEMQMLDNQMLANYQNLNYSGDYYLNASAAGDSGQSFMLVTDPAPTPEPPTLITLATGLIAMAFFARRRLLQA